FAVQRARNLNYKGKNDTNDAFVVIALGKDKFQTSIKEKATSAVEWHEECELAIPSHGNTAALSLTVYHRNALGMDEFLGQMHMPLSEFDVYERPRNRWHKLKGKPDKDRKKGEKERGDLEVRVAFTVKSGSLLDVSADKKKNKSITSLKNLGGSLMSLGNKEKANIKSFAKSVSHKIDKIAQKPGKKKKSRKESTEDGQGFPSELMQSKQRAGDADPGVISDSDEDDFGFSEEVRVNTRSSSPYSTVSRGSSLQQEDEGMGLNGNTTPLSEPHAPPKPARLGGSIMEVPTIALDSPTPSPEPSPLPPRQPPPRQPPPHQPPPPTTQPPPPTTQPPPPTTQPQTPPTQPQTPPTLTFPNLTPITLPGQKTLARGSSSPDSALPSSLTSSVGGKDSLPSQDSSPEPVPAVRKLPQVPSPVKDTPRTPATPPPESPKSPKIIPDPTPVPSKAPISKKSSLGKSTSESLAPAKPIRSGRSSSVTDAPASTPELLQAPVAKSRSFSTSSTPTQKAYDQPAPLPMSPKSKDGKGKGFALAALATASAKISLVENEAISPLSPPAFQAKTDTFPRPKPPTSTSSSIFTFSSDSGTPSAPNTPKDSSSVPSPAPTSSSSSRGTPGLAERPGAAVVRSGSLHEKPTSPPVLDEWERKLYGRNAIVGSMENMTHSDSHSSLNTSRSSSTQDLHRIEEHRSRFPETKALTLDRKPKDSTEDGSSSEGNKKRWGKSNLKSKLFGGKGAAGSNDSLPRHQRSNLMALSGSRERIGEEDGRVVEGGNDRLPHPPTRQSRLPQEIHDKFAGKSREDLMETIVSLQSMLEKNAKHTRDLEDYIDNLLLRVMETTPQLLQAPANSTGKSKKLKVFDLH
ncbi:rab11 family-interacting protein 1-like, partial [Eriocheir sinensis]|uniref:rab11 family-interacting protein 1-like n=1 Tax=Eriocheir sinensis TaxID=95602 RepID=UPI0021C6CD83